MVAAGCSGTPKQEDVSGLGEKGLIMTQRYIQPYANPQLNSCQGITLQAAGTLGWKFAFNTPEYPGGARYLHLIDGQRAIIDYEDIFFVLDLRSRRLIATPMKSANTFIRLDEGQKFWFCADYQLLGLEFDQIEKGKIGQEVSDQAGEESETAGQSEGEDSSGEESGSAIKHFFVPGLGQYSELKSLNPGPQSFIAGVQGFGNPMHPHRSFSLYQKPYPGTQKTWVRECEGLVVRPPFSPSGQAVIAHTDTMILYDRGGRIVGEVAGEKVGPFEPVTCSIGPDNRIYLVCTTEAGPRLRIYDFWGELMQEIGGVTAEPTQPPIVGVDSTVYLIDTAKVEAFKDGKKLWAYPLTSEAPAATVSGDGKLLITDGVRILCLDQGGEEVWSYKDEDGDLFTTPPVIDEAGHVLVASDNVIIMIK